MISPYFLSLSAADARDGDRALKAAQGTSQNGLMIARYFISVTVDARDGDRALKAA